MNTTNRPSNRTMVRAASVCLCALTTSVLAQECPELVASLQLERPTSLQIAVSENYAYLMHWGNVLTVVDVASPAQPAALWAGGGLCACDPGVTLDLEASGGVVFNFQWCAPSFGGFVCVIDARSPESPVVLPADFSLHHFSLDSLAVSEGYLYFAGYPYRADYPYDPEYVGLKVFDVLEPSSPVEVGSFHYLPDSVDPGGFAVDVVVSGSYVYLLAGSRLTVIDVLVPSSPVEVGALELPESGERVAVSGSYAYVETRTGEWPEWQSTLRVIDMSTPSSPVEVGSVGIQGNVASLAVDSSYAYISLFDELSVIDVRVPSSPIEVGFVALPDQRFEDVAVSGRYVYVVGGDLSDPDPATAGRLYVFDTWGCRRPWQHPMMPLALE